MGDGQTILIVDDQPDIRESLSEHLSQRGFCAMSAADAKAARSLIANEAIDLVVLDIMMPGEDGLSLCRYLRETLNKPVILLTALVDDTDRIVGLEIGADDYVTKPFNPRELVARIKSVLRRASKGGQGAPLTEQWVSFDKWRLNLVQSELIDESGLVVSLSNGELALLSVFLDHSRKALSRDQLMQQTHGRDVFPFERSIDNMIRRLRRKLEVEPSAPRLIRTVRGDGYMFTAEVKR